MMVCFIYKRKITFLENFVVDTLLHIKKRKKNEEPAPNDYSEEGDMEVLPMILDCIFEVSSIKINLPNDLTRSDNKMMVKETLKEVKIISD